MLTSALGLCENVREPRMHRIVFSIVVSQRKLLVQLVSASTKLRQMFYTQIERRSFHTAWVKNGSVRARAARRFYPQVQTSSACPGMSVWCHKQSSCAGRTATSCGTNDKRSPTGRLTTSAIAHRKVLKWYRSVATGQDLRSWLAAVRIFAALIYPRRQHAHAPH